MSDNKFREIIGYTFDKTSSYPENWMKLAREFMDTAHLIAKSDEYSPPYPFYFNAGLSLELALKAIAVAKRLDFKKTHRLNDLQCLIGLKISKNQESTLQLLSEMIIWSGRYPTPKTEGQWDNYHDAVRRRHLIHKEDGNRHMVLANKNTFPTIHNFLAIWTLCDQDYDLATKNI